MRLFGSLPVWSLALALAACTNVPPNGPVATNPFLEDLVDDDKADTGYHNPDGIEVEVDLESDIDLTGGDRSLGPARLGEFALTYLRKRGHFYLESLAEDASSDDRVEWLVNDNWITAAKAENVSSAKLNHFRIRGMNAVLLLKDRKLAKEGAVYQATVPVRPFDMMSQAGKTCAERDEHLALEESLYWYLWDPDRSACKVETQEMTVTVSKLLPQGHTTYPEYDRLITAAAKETDPARRRGIFERCEEILVREQLPIAPLFVPVNMALIAPGLSGVEPNLASHAPLAYAEIIPSPSGGGQAP